MGDTCYYNALDSNGDTIGVVTCPPSGIAFCGFDGMPPILYAHFSGDGPLDGLSVPLVWFEPAYYGLQFPECTDTGLFLTLYCEEGVVQLIYNDSGVDFYLGSDVPVEPPPAFFWKNEDFQPATPCGGAYQVTVDTNP